MRFIKTTMKIGECVNKRIIFQIKRSLNSEL
jgi:hypothetical protein